MGQTTHEIESAIETEREALKSNIQELETRVKSAADWRHYFRDHTGAMIAVAFGGGVILSALTKPRARNRYEAASSERRPSGAKHEVHENFEHIVSALVGTAATKFKSVLAELIPGFSDQLAQRESGLGRDTTH